MGAKIWQKQMKMGVFLTFLDFYTRVSGFITKFAKRGVSL